MPSLSVDELGLTAALLPGEDGLYTLGEAEFDYVLAQVDSRGVILSDIALVRLAHLLPCLIALQTLGLLGHQSSRFPPLLWTPEVQLVRLRLRRIF